MNDFMDYDFDVKAIAVVCYVPPNGGTPIHKNRPNHGLVFHTSGDRVYTFPGQEIHAGPGDIVYLPQYSDYVVKTMSPGGCYAINFTLQSSVSFQPFSFKAKNSAGFLDYFKQAETVWRMQSPGYTLKCKAMLYSILYTLHKEYKLGYLPKADEILIRPALEYIHQEYANDNISITKLASLCRISETLFRRKFQNVTGLSPLKYINALKISRAKELIQSDLYSISEIALLSGFHDEAYFSREFKKAVGVAPSKYR